MGDTQWKKRHDMKSILVFFVVLKILISHPTSVLFLYYRFKALPKLQKAPWTYHS